MQLKRAKNNYNDNERYAFNNCSDIFHAAYRGQEFVIESRDEENMKKWIMDIIKG